MLLKLRAAALCALFLSVPAMAVEDPAAAVAAAKKWVAEGGEEPADFAAGARLADRLSTVPGPEAALWRYRVIARALSGVDYESKEKEPAKSWLARHESEVGFSEPSGAYNVTQEKVWELWEKSKASPVAEEIAWEAANTPLGGECEGYLTCYLEADLRGIGRYLENYPKGKWAKEGAGGLYWLNEAPMAEEFPLDPADQAEAKKLLQRWDKILAAMADNAAYRQGLAAVIKAYKLK